MNSFMKVSQIISKKFEMNQKVLIMKIFKINKKVLIMKIFKINKKIIRFRISINRMLWRKNKILLILMWVGVKMKEISKIVWKKFKMIIY